jgi:putative Ca2+/H+ antiporter (TMEM165/GDT1 family)
MIWMILSASESGVTMLYLLIATFGTIFLTELLGDKSIYTIGSLVIRFRPLPVFCGLTVAFMGKMLAAVMVGQAINNLPTILVTITSTMTFFITAFVIWLKRSKPEPTEREPLQRSSRAALISFAAIFFSEWGDVGQVTTATLLVNYQANHQASFQAPLTVWCGATTALMTKGVLAMVLGREMRKRFPRNILRWGAVCLCLTIGVVSALQLIFK